MASNEESPEVSIGAMRVPAGSDIAGLLARALSGKGNTPDTPAPVNTEHLQALRQTYERYIKAYGVHDCPAVIWRPGQLITPVAGCAMNSQGRPHIVLETRETGPDFRTGGDELTPSSNGFGNRRDMRVCAYVQEGRYVAHWVESYEFTLYEPA